MPTIIIVPIPMKSCATIHLTVIKITNLSLCNVYNTHVYYYVNFLVKWIKPRGMTDLIKLLVGRCLKSTWVCDFISIFIILFCLYTLHAATTITDFLWPQIFIRSHQLLRPNYSTWHCNSFLNIMYIALNFSHMQAFYYYRKHHNNNNIVLSSATWEDWITKLILNKMFANI